MSEREHVRDIGAGDFDALVIEGSRQRPVLVDFWAAWCGPCRALTPTLEGLAREHGGRFMLAKVDTDAHGELAAAYGVRGLPTVKLFTGGVVVEELVGLQPESTLRAMLERHLPRESDARREEAHRQAAAGRLAEARALLDEALASDPGNLRLAPDLADVLLQVGEIEAVDALLGTLRASQRLEEVCQQAEARLGFARAAAQGESRNTLEARLGEHAGDCDARFALGSHLASEQRYEEAAEHLLEVLRRDRRFRDGAARKALLAIFKILGDHDPRVPEYRSRLASALF
jgi:putative thioredoxin